jgi:hypothetical protein
MNGHDSPKMEPPIKVFEGSSKLAHPSVPSSTSLTYHPEITDSWLGFEILIDRFRVSEDNNESWLDA